MGWALAASVVLVAAAILVEHHRANPLINTRWLSSREMLRLMTVGASIRVLLSEQAFGSVGLLNLVGMINDQLVVLNLIIIVASIAGLVTAVLTFRPTNLARPIIAAVILIVIGSFMDAGSDNLTRPSSFYVSQALIGFASLLFLAQVTAIGLARTLLAGGRNFVGYIVLFTLGQSIGGLIGTALLGTFQTLREKFHSHELVQQIVAANPQVAARLDAGGRLIIGAGGDPALRSAEGIALLSQQVTREANILAYNDVFLLVGVLAILVTIWGFLITRSIRRRNEPSPVLLLLQRLQQQARQRE
jgi:hypothetical protein